MDIHEAFTVLEENWLGAPNIPCLHFHEWLLHQFQNYFSPEKEDRYKARDFTVIEMMLWRSSLSELQWQENVCKITASLVPMSRNKTQRQSRNKTVADVYILVPELYFGVCVVVPCPCCWDGGNFHFFSEGKLLKSIFMHL